MTLDWKTVVPLVVVHLLPLLAIWTGASAFDWALCFGLYVSRMFFVTAGYHRLLAHQSYKTSRPLRFLMAFGAMTSGQGGPLWWAGRHRQHHRFADTEDDVHSPNRGFWYAHVGWLLTTEHAAVPYEFVRDLERAPELVWLERYRMLPPLLLAGGVWAAFGTSALAIGVGLSTVLLYHATFAINSFAHWGGRSRNSAWLAALTLGEGWHEDHHKAPSACRQGRTARRIDITWLVLRAMSRGRLVWGLRRAPGEPG